MKNPPPSQPTRDRLVGAMADALQRRGLHGVGLSELLDRAGAPKGVLYHHFPGGKNELAVAAIRSAVARLGTALDQLLATHAEPGPALASWMETSARLLESSAYERGCPLATVALESGAHDQAIRDALAEGFAAIRERIVEALGAASVSAAKSRRLAALIVSAYEGALLQARVARSTESMRDTMEVLLDLVRLETRGRGR